MSKLTDYLKLIPKALGNPQQVIEGWINAAKLENGSLKEDEIEEIVRRRAICQGCPLLSVNVRKDPTEYERLMGEEFTDKRTEDFCSMCGCPSEKMTASFSKKCGLDYYNINHPDNKQELKWTSYIKK